MIIKEQVPTELLHLRCWIRTYVMFSSLRVIILCGNFWQSFSSLDFSSKLLPCDIMSMCFIFGNLDPESTIEVQVSFDVCRNEG